jgi:hypothetical protein
MPEGTIVFVHGTGVRLKAYRRGFDSAREQAAKFGITAAFVECAWGDPLGIAFEGRSVPGEPSEKQLREAEEDFAQWSWLFDDPLHELLSLTIRDTSDVAKPPKPPPNRKPSWKQLWDKIAAYQPSSEFELLLERGGLKAFWPQAWSQIVVPQDIAELAFERSAHELPEASNALARALVAELHVVAVGHRHPGPNRALRDSLVLRLLNDWEQVVYAKSGFFANLLKRAATRALRRHRNDFMDAAAFPIGDVLLYQSRGATVRDYIRSKIVKAEPPVTVIAHSLGGIACFDLLSMPDPPPITSLVTVGSQSSLLYEIGALASLKPPQPLPKGFPRWLNIYDRNDFLSYVAKPLFAEADDLEVESGQPFPESHSAYFTNDKTWMAIHELGVR